MVYCNKALAELVPGSIMCDIPAVSHKFCYFCAKMDVPDGFCLFRGGGRPIGNQSALLIEHLPPFYPKLQQLTRFWTEKVFDISCFLIILPVDHRHTFKPCGGQSLTAVGSNVNRVAISMLIHYTFSYFHMPWQDWHSFWNISHIVTFVTGAVKYEYVHYITG